MIGLTALIQSGQNYLYYYHLTALRGAVVKSLKAA